MALEAERGGSLFLLVQRDRPVSAHFPAARSGALTKALEPKKRGSSIIALSEGVIVMLQTYTAVVKHDEGSWIGWIEEVPGVNCQEATREELLQSLRVTLTEAIEFNRAEARGAAGKGYEELPIAV